MGPGYACNQKNDYILLVTGCNVVLDKLITDTSKRDEKKKTFEQYVKQNSSTEIAAS